MKPLFFIYLLAGLIFVQCKTTKPDNSVQPGESATLHDFSGLDGCGWIIQLDESDKNGIDKLEPTNLDSFKLLLSEGQRVRVKYKTRNDLHSVCMAGKIVDLTDITVK